MTTMACGRMMSVSRCNTTTLLTTELQATIAGRLLPLQHTRPVMSRAYALPPPRARRRVLQAQAAASYSESPDVALQRLGLPYGASPQDVKKAYRKLALQFHPDVCKSDSCATTFMQITNAYEVIMNNLQGKVEAITREPFAESMMGVYGEDWDDWEEWMGWEGAGTLDYSNHINSAL
ncbi:hypothetical protein L7F22_034515 [Adiantum nelumboides]|nr:hypothetical protein [Adiantum nelumboides]